MTNMRAENGFLRLAELMASFSMAMDLGVGQPMEWVMRTCLLGVRLGQLLGLPEDELKQVYYLSLLRHIGCTSTATMESAVFGDELNMSEALVTDSKNPAEALRFLLHTPGKGQPLSARLRFLGKALAAGPAMKDEVDSIQCEVAGQLAGQLSFEPQLLRALAQVFERWDGRGVPHQLKGDMLFLPVRIIHLAHDTVTLQQIAGLAAAIELAQMRANRLYDPALVELFCQAAPDLFAQLETASTWEAILAAEPGTPLWLTEAQFDQALLAVADFTDLKSPYFAGHSRGVAALAEAAARECRLPEIDAVMLRRAGLIHDLGKVGVSAGIWNKPGPLTEGEWERVRLHPYLTERILARSSTFAPLIELAALHHECLDGSGYHRRLPANLLPLPARLLTAANSYQAMMEPRSYRPVFSAEAAAAKLHLKVQSGKLDATAVEAVLSAAGHRVRAGRRSAPGGLSQREVEVLRLMARGLSNRQMAQQLILSQKTVGHHVQHIYNKIGVSTRAGATLFAIQHNLLSDFDPQA